MEFIIGGISALTALIGAIWGIVKYYDQKRVKIQSEIDKREEQRDAILMEISLQLEKTQETIAENELDRLRCSILSAVRELRNGFEMSQVDLEHIHHCYDKYSAHGGNSYVASCMEYVYDYERQCREAGILGFENNNNDDEE